jgi:hypothetical protein
MPPRRRLRGKQPVQEGRPSGITRFDRARISTILAGHLGDGLKANRWQLLTVCVLQQAHQLALWEFRHQVLYLRTRAKGRPTSAKRGKVLRRSAHRIPAADLTIDIRRNSALGNLSKYLGRLQDEGLQILRLGHTFQGTSTTHQFLGFRWGGHLARVTGRQYRNWILLPLQRYHEVLNRAHTRWVHLKRRQAILGWHRRHPGRRNQGGLPLPSYTQNVRGNALDLSAREPPGGHPAG